VTTDGRRAEDSGEEARLLREVLDCSAELIWAVDAEHLSLITFNRALERALAAGAGVTVARGMLPEDMLPTPELTSGWRRAYLRALAEGGSEFEGGLGGEQALHATLTALSRDGRPWAVAVAAGAQAEPALRRREAFFRKVLETSADVTSVLAADGRRLFISSGVTAVLGYSEEEALALPVAVSTHPDDQARVIAAFRKLVATPAGSIRIRFRQRHKNGSWRLVDAIVRNACDDPAVGGVVVTTRDVTEQVLLEEQFLQAQKLESVGRLAGGVAHDFNNLLTVILSCTELLQGQTTGPGAEYVGEILAAAERARGLTRQLLAFARKEVVAPGPLDLTAQVRASEKILRRLVGEDVEVVTSLETPLWPVICDAGQVDQVLFNLVVNARDAMPRGGRITIETANVPGEGGTPDLVRLVVRDSGVGISDEARPHLFEPFFTTKPSGKGTGLGLATVHGIVQQHGGRLGVESAPGEGAAFEVLLPRCQPRADRPEASPHAAPHAAQERILLVEDDPRVRRVAEQALAAAGYRVVTASDGEAAKQLLGQRGLSLDLVVSDVVLPRADGLEVAEFARQERPALPLLFTSGYPAERLSHDGVIGPDIDFLPKPFTPSVLLQRVRTALDRQRP
jgi:two-component system, cell cycle sensor histidine kinase and response regulator CckA